MRSAAKIDRTQTEIVNGLRAVGAAVQSIAAVGKGCPDLLVSFRGKWYVAEIKDGSKSASRRKLTLAEEEWHARFSLCAPVHTWASLDDALRTIGAG